MYVDGLLQHPCGNTIITELATPQLDVGVWQYNDAYTTIICPYNPDGLCTNAGKTRLLDHN
jgi:hypothetical protein